MWPHHSIIRNLYFWTSFLLQKGNLKRLDLPWGFTAVVTTYPTRGHPRRENRDRQLWRTRHREIQKKIYKRRKSLRSKKLRAKEKDSKETVKIKRYWKIKKYQSSGASVSWAVGLVNLKRSCPKIYKTSFKAPMTTFLAGLWPLIHLNPNLSWGCPMIGLRGGGVPFHFGVNTLMIVQAHCLLLQEMSAPSALHFWFTTVFDYMCVCVEFFFSWSLCSSIYWNRFFF